MLLPPSGNPIICHGKVLYLQPLIPPTKCFDIFPPLTGGCSEGLGAFDGIIIVYYYYPLNCSVVVVVFFTLIDRASTYPVMYVVANPVRGHKEVPRSTSHIMVTTRYSDQQGSKSQQKVMRLYKQWHRPISKRFIRHPYSIHREQPRSARIVVAYPRPAFSATNWTPLVMYYSVVMFGGSA